MGLRTSLYNEHVALNARLVDFGGWDMPVQYASVLEEHHAVRRGVGMFDVSHMTLLELTGPDAMMYLQRLLANDVAKLTLPGKALYSVMLNERGGVIDDLIVYAPTPEQPELWRVIVNCGTHDKDLAWMQANAAAVRQAAKAGSAGHPAAGQSLLAITNASALAAGLKLQRFEPEGERRVRVTLENAVFTDVMGWIVDLEQRNGVTVESFSADGQPQPGIVNIRLTLGMPS